MLTTGGIDFQVPLIYTAYYVYRSVYFCFLLY